MLVELVVDGQPRSVEVRPEARLLDLLRDHLQITGPKEGCGVGECGACTVLMDGEAVNSCLVPAWQAHGREIVTPWGLGSPEAPSAVQAAFASEGAVQCGFCTPGFTVATTHLLQRHPQPTVEQIREGLSGNLCRCTGYSSIIAAVQHAAEERHAEGGQDATCNISEDVTGSVLTPAGEPDRVGARPLRVDALDKATGRTRYTADLQLPEGCLHGAVVRCTEPHARLLSVDPSPALALEGVVRVLTAADAPGARTWGNAIEDQPVFAWDLVRFAGEAVALVLAESEALARQAASLVRVEVEPLPLVDSPEQALEPDAPLLHQDGNLPVHQRLRRGEVAAELDAADVLVQRTYRTAAQEHLCLEPEVALAMPEADGSLTVRAPSQNVFFDRHHLCRILDLPPKQIRVVQEPTGAAFGSREDLYAQHHAALGALITGRPVRVQWTREETQVATVKRHPATVRIRMGADRAGHFRAVEVEVLADTGAYASWAPNIARKMLVHASGPYAWPAVSVDVRMAYTNHGVAGAFRGFGAPQVAFAVESAVDELAAELGMDPAELRRLNHLRVGSVTATGQELTGSCGLAECVERALEAAEVPLEAPEPGWRRGRGLATIHYGIGYGNRIPDIGSAVAELEPEGITLRCGAIDYGQGALTVFTQIAGEVLGISRRALTLITGDSAITPNSGSTVASRQTYVSGEAVRQASERLRATLLDLGVSAWGHPREALSLGDSGLLLSREPVATWAELHAAASEAGVRTRRQARFKATTTRLDLETGQGDAYWPYAWAAHVVDVDVHEGSGRVRVRRVVAAHDVGRAIHPGMVEGQIAGGVVQGLGMALWEEHAWKNGQPTTTNLDRYRIPGLADAPEVVPVIVEDPEPTGPFGAKGVGEPTLVAVIPAVANAIFAATGRRIRELPITPERILGVEAVPRGMRPTAYSLQPTACRVLRPNSWEKAARMLTEGARPLAGATDALVALRAGAEPPTAWVDLSGIAEGHTLEESDGWLVLGALLTHSQLGDSELVRQHLPALWAAARAMGSPPIRHRGTLGGNLVHASPAADMAPPLLAHEAEVHLHGQGWRPLLGFFTGPGRTVLQPGQLLTAVRARPGKMGHFARLGGRERHIISKASLALTTRVEEGVLHEVRIALGAVAPTPVRSPAAEAVLEGRRLDDTDAITLASQALLQDMAPIDDQRSSADYRRRAVAVLLEEVLRHLA